MFSDCISRGHRVSEGTGDRIVTFTDLLIMLPNETLEQIDDDIKRLHTSVSDREEFVELAVEYALQSLREES
jgi:hypothetical protein